MAEHPKKKLSVKIRPFKPEDQDAAKELILAGMQEHWGQLDATKNPDLNDIARSYADATFLVAVLGEEIVGTGALRRRENDSGEIVRMSVGASFRRRGIGRQMLDALIAAARAAGMRRIILETTSTWADAIAFYRSYGFRELYERDGDTYFELRLDWD